MNHFEWSSIINLRPIRRSVNRWFLVFAKTLTTKHTDGLDEKISGKGIDCPAVEHSGSRTLDVTAGDRTSRRSSSKTGVLKVPRQLSFRSIRFGSVPLTVVALACLALAGCGGENQKQFSALNYPFSFSYPSGWKLTRNASFNYGSGSGERSLSIALKEPFDQVTITQYKLRRKLKPNENGNRREVDRVVAKLTTQANGTASDATTVKYGGTPGYQYVVEYPAADGTELRNTLTFLFKGEDEFQINCQSSPKHRTDLDKGCEMVLGSLKFK